MASPVTTLPLLLFLVVGLVSHGNAARGPAQRAALGMETLSNTFDGSVLGDCITQSDVEAGKPHETWITFGSVRQGRELGWEGVTSVTRCGDGPFESAGVLVPDASAVPYLAISVETVASVRGDRTNLKATLRTRKLAKFDDQGGPVFIRDELKRQFDLGPGEFAIVPVLIANERERDTFDVHELYVRLTARVVGREAVTYGSISVTAEVPGLDILLDGGAVGRSLEKAPVVLRNIRVGKHEVRVTDLSGRTASKQVVVEKNRTVEARLTILDLPSPLPSGATLVSIGRNPQGYDEYWRVRDRAVMVKVPAGEFLMGSAENEGEPAQRPQRHVHVSEYLIDKTEVTWRQFRRYADATGARMPPTPVWGTLEDYPTTSVLHAEAKAYCEWIGGRLPTEAEWEKAARGTDGRKYTWGNDWDPDRCNSIDGGPHQPKGVGSFPGCVSPYGIVDMAGSLWEWTADWYADGYPQVSEQDPKGPDRGTHRVMRGGSWLWSRFFLYTAYRHKIEPNWRDVHNGFRCARTAPR